MSPADLRSAPAPGRRPEDHVRGEGPLVVFYGDFTCPHCALADARLGTVAVTRVFRHFALRTKHPRAQALGAAAEAAGRQGAFWAFHDACYADQGRLDDPHLWELVRGLGLDVERFDNDRRDEAAIGRVERDTREAIRAGLVTTPTLLVDGVAHPGPPDARMLELLRR